MSTEEVAQKLVQYCREGKNDQAIDELYADNILSLETKGSVTRNGKAEVLAASAEWYQTVEEIHSGSVSDPMVAGDFFVVNMQFDITFKGRGRTQMTELCVYEVKDGKITFEEFFYAMP